MNQTLAGILDYGEIIGLSLFFSILVMYTMWGMREEGRGQYKMVMVLSGLVYLACYLISHFAAK